MGLECVTCLWYHLLELNAFTIITPKVITRTECVTLFLILSYFRNASCGTWLFTNLCTTSISYKTTPTHVHVKSSILAMGDLELMHTTNACNRYSVKVLAKQSTTLFCSLNRCTNLTIHCLCMTLLHLGNKLALLTP